MGYRNWLFFLCSSLFVYLGVCVKVYELTSSVVGMNSTLYGSTGIAYCCAVIRHGYNEVECKHEQRLVSFCLNGTYKNYIDTKLSKVFKMEYVAGVVNLNIDTYHHFCCSCVERSKCQLCFVNMMSNTYFCFSRIVSGYNIESILQPIIYPTQVLVWFKFGIVPLYSELFPLVDVVRHPYLPLKVDNYLRIKAKNSHYVGDEKYINTYHKLSFSDRRCNRKLVEFNYFGFSEARDCVRVVHRNVGCPNSTVKLQGHCDWAKFYSTSLGNYVICRAPKFLKTKVYMVSGSLNGLCNYNSFYVGWPAMVWYLTVLSDVSLRFLPLFLGVSDDSYYFETSNTQQYRDFLTRYDYTFKYLSEPVKALFPVEMICSKSNQLPVKLRYLASDVRFFDIILPFNECQSYIQYNSTYDICEMGLVSTDIICPDVLFRKRKFRSFLPDQNVTFSLTAPSISFSNNFTCHSLADFGLCALSNVLNDFKNNFTSRLNSTAFSVLQRFFDVMGANSSSLEFYHQFGSDSGNKVLVGNWISGIFGVLIKPFFDVFTVMIKSLLEEFGELLILVITRFVVLFESLIDPLTNLFGMLWKLVITIIVLIESKFLLLEYTLLFLILLTKVFNGNNVSAIIVIVIAMIIFGIERKHPSFILYFVNAQFVYIDLSYYYNAKFSWNYTLTYIDSATNTTISLF